MADIAVEAQTNAVKVLGSVSGTNTITASMSPALTAYSNKMFVLFTPAGTNTTAVTININGLGAKDVLKQGAACSGGELTAYPAILVYTGTNFELLNPQTQQFGLYWKFDSSARLLNSGNTQPGFLTDRQTSSQTLTASTVSTVVFNTEYSDNGSCYDNTTGIFTAPVTGFYEFQCGLRLQNNATGSAVINDVFFSHNNGASGAAKCYSLSGFGLGSSITASSNAFTISGSFIIYLASTDTIRVKVSMGTVGGVGGFTLNTSSYFSGALRA
jgi:hypothetical protein